MNVKTLEFTTESVEQTHALGRAIGEGVDPGTVIALKGPLGAGKTHLTQGIADGLGVSRDEYVVSPTFVVIIEHHSGRMPLYHVDLYRLEEAEEAGEIGLFDMMASEALTVVEWADRFPEIFPPDTVWIDISIGEASRTFVLSIPENHSNMLKSLINF